ncbi:uncharacterized protein LOC142320887 [Lycorma delicatula]|uniref:uncharacterized protein LOC142320887 n=1 Tax=Lycorma delicatula TaxID=130591 RepID=UPI003F50E5C7
MRNEELNREFQDKQVSLMQHQNNLHQPNGLPQQNMMIHQQPNALQQQIGVMPQQIVQHPNEIPIVQSPTLNGQYSVPVRVPSVQIPTLKALMPSPVQEPKHLNAMELIIRPEETPAQKAEKSNEAFEKLLQFMTIMGQVDAYISEKTQSALRTIAKIAEENTENKNRF